MSNISEDLDMFSHKHAKEFSELSELDYDHAYWFLRKFADHVMVLVLINEKK